MASDTEKVRVDAEDLEEYKRAVVRGGRQFPAGRHGLPAEFVAQAQRDRIIDGMAYAVAEKGYGATTVKDVIALAGVSRRTFYENFKDKEDCFLAAYETLSRRMLEEVFEGFRRETSWPLAIRAGVERLLAWFAREPAYARAGIIEVLAAGKEALKRRDAALRAFFQAFDPAQRNVPDHGLPAIVIEATIGGIFEVLYSRILTDGPEAVAEMTPEITYLALAPFVGNARAAKYAER